MTIKVKALVEEVVAIETICISAKVRCSGSYTFQNVEGENVSELADGSYVPDFFPTKHYGDYWDFKIDIETGKILNWVKPTEEQLKAMINPSEED